MKKKIYISLSVLIVLTLSSFTQLKKMDHQPKENVFFIRIDEIPNYTAYQDRVMSINNPMLRGSFYKTTKEFMDTKLRNQFGDIRITQIPDVEIYSVLNRTALSNDELKNQIITKVEAWASDINTYADTHTFDEVQTKVKNELHNIRVY